jgi:hypothetical protein
MQKMHDNSDFVFTRLGQVMYAIDHATNDISEAAMFSMKPIRLEARRIESELKRIYAEVDNLQREDRKSRKRGGQ